MELQLALDRMNVEEAIRIAKKTEAFIDYAEVGTSLVKEFGVRSIYEMKKALPEKQVLADMKVMDNAVYESKLAFDAGADLLTVMGAAPIETIEACMNEAQKRGRRVMIDLLNTSPEKTASLLHFQAIFCVHASKDLQESGKGNVSIEMMEFLKKHPVRIAAAGGITAAAVPVFKTAGVDHIIAGSSITKAEDPAAAAAELKKACTEGVVNR